MVIDELGGHIETKSNWYEEMEYDSQTAETMAVDTMGGTEKWEVFPVILLIILYLLSAAGFVYDVKTLKGVFLYDDYMEINNGLFPLKRKYHYYDITGVALAGSFHRDLDRVRLSYYSNLLAGNGFRPCVKFQMNGRKWRFVGVEDISGLYQEISLRTRGDEYDEE